MFITFEGIDRSGKTTQARMLAEALGEDVVLVREPGGTPAAERIRDLVKGETDLTPMAETLLFGAARAELVERVIRPALAEGRTVISDRYGDSTVAYQGGARGLGIERVEQLNHWLTGNLEPDVTFLSRFSRPPRPAGVASWIASSARAKSCSAPWRRPMKSSPSATPAASYASTRRALPQKFTRTCWRGCRCGRDRSARAPAARAHLAGGRTA